jgi:hypothetical protein
MAEHDPRITDLRRYRRERERARRAQQAARPRRGGAEPLLGRRKNAGLILALVVIVLIVMSLLGHRF